MNRNDGGFTLMEILVALGILGAALFILLDTHYGALRLFDTVQEEVILHNLIEQVIGTAEVGVLTEELSGDGDFGGRYPDYSWSYNAEQSSEDETIPLYEIKVTIKTPSEERELVTYFFDIRQQWVEEL